MPHLKLVNINDLQLFRDLYQTPECMKHICACLTETEVKQTLDSCIKFNSRRDPLHSYYKIELEHEKFSAGLVSLHKKNAREFGQVVEIGIILQPELHGSGIGIQLIASLCMKLISDWNQPKILLKCRETNTRLGSIMSRLGFSLSKSDGMQFWLMVGSPAKVAILNAAGYTSLDIQLQEDL